MGASQTITLGGGCFWCTEAAFQLVRGVTEVSPGYAGGSVPYPTYDAVCTRKTGHAEVVQLRFDLAAVSLAQVLDVFWTIHDPTTPDSQGNDVGSQYRSIILYSDSSQLGIIHDSIASAQKLWGGQIVTEIRQLEAFYQAEPEHHNCFRNHPERGYCQAVINPKLAKLRAAYQSLLQT